MRTYQTDQRSVKRKIAILTDHTYLPDRVGGRESSIHELALELRAAGWLPTVVAKKSKKPRTFSLLSRERYISRYEVIRDKNPIEKFIELVDSGEMRGSIVNVDNRNLPDLIGKLRRSLIYYRDLQNVENIMGRDELEHFGFIANSNFVAVGVEKALARRPIVVPPLIRGELYQGLGAGDFVTFINPIPKKGLDVAIELARHLPNIPFLFLESWPLGKAEWKTIVQACRPCANIVLRRSSLSMKSIYRKTRILLAPSQWIEAWGRVVTEAQFNGIPAVTSDSGGLPEAVGRGGIIVPREAPIEDWVAAVQGLYEDQSRWAKFSLEAEYQSKVYSEYRDARYSDMHELLSSMVVPKFA